MSSERLHQRLREMRARAAIRACEARQADYAHGVWLRFELLLARTRRALAIDAGQAAALRAAGFEAHPVGMEIEPPKTLFVIDEEALPEQSVGPRFRCRTDAGSFSLRRCSSFRFDLDQRVDLAEGGLAAREV